MDVIERRLQHQNDRLTKLLYFIMRRGNVKIPTDYELDTLEDLKTKEELLEWWDAHKEYYRYRMEKKIFYSKRRKR